MENFELAVLLKIKDTFTAEFTKAIDNIAAKMTSTEGVTVKSTSAMGNAITFLKNNWIALSVGINQAMGVISMVTSKIDQLVAFGKAGVDVLRVEQAFSAVAKSSGYASEQLITDWKRATREMVDDTQMMSFTMNLLLEGVKAEKITEMMELLTKMAPVAGKSLEQAIQQVSAAAITGRTRAIMLMTGHLDLNAELEKYADRLGTSTRRMDEQDKTAARLQIIYDAMIKRSKELGDVQNQVAVEFDRATTKIQNQREELQKLAAPYATWWLQFKVGVLGTIKWLNELEPALNLERGLFNKRGKSLKDMSESNVKVLEAEAAAWEAFSGKVSPVMPALKPLKPLSPEEQREFEKVMAGLLEDERERITQTDKLQEDAYKRQFEGAKNLGELVVALRRSTADKLRAIDSKYLEEGAKAEKETFEVMSKFAMIEIDQRESVAKAYGDETDVMEARHAKELQVMKDKYSQTEKWDSTYAKEYLNLIQIQTIEVEKNLAKQFEARVKSNEDYENLLLEQVQYIRGMEEEKLSIQGEDLAAMKLRHRTEVEALQKKYKDFETHDATYTNAHLALIERQGVQIVDLEKQKARTREDFQLETTAKLIELTGTEYDAFKTSQDKQRISWKRMLDDKIISQKNYNDRIAVADKELNEKLLLASDDFFAGLELARAKDAQKRYTWAQAGVDIWNDAIKNMTSATSDFLFYGLQGKWSDALKVFQNFGLAMLRSYTDTLAKMIVETASAEATMAAIRAAYRGIAAWLGFGGGGELGGIGETYGEGGIVKGGFVPIRAFQGGGIVRRPTLGLVGEGGQDEAVIPLQGGKVPVDLRGGQESAPIIININAVDANSFVNLLANNRRVLAQLIASSIGTPGPLRSAVRGT